MSDKDGGSAFPVHTERGLTYLGMTLRDYFAAKAMQGLIAQSDGSALESSETVGAEYAYRMADAMIKERAK